MKKLLTLTVILYSLIFSSVSFGEWTEVGTTKVGDTYYVDLERMRIHNGFKYLWRLSDFLEPTESGLLSASIYTQIDCKEFRVRNLQYIYYKQPMGEGSGESEPSSDKDWYYPTPDSLKDLMIKKGCEK